MHVTRAGSQTTNPLRTSGFRFSTTTDKVASDTTGGQEVYQPEAAAHTTVIASRKGVWATAGTGLMLALSVGGAFTATSAMAATTPPADVQMIPSRVDSTDTARTANANPVIPGDAAAQQILAQLPGAKLDGVFNWLFSGKFNPATAVKKLDTGTAIQVPRPGSSEVDTIKNREQLAELGTMRGVYPGSGVADGIVHAFQATEKAGGFSSPSGPLTAYQAFDQVRHGGSVTDTQKGRSYVVSTPAQVQELNALEGDGQANPLAPATSDLLKRMTEGTPGEGMTQHGRSLNAYETLQALQAGQSTDYNFHGGPYHEALSLPVGGLANLGTVAHTVANQHAADAVRPSVRFFMGQMQPLVQAMQPGIDSDIATAQALITGGQTDAQNYSGAAAQETQAVTAAVRAVDEASAGLDATMPAYNTASDRLSQARRTLDYVAGEASGARSSESSALAANQDANARLADARARIQQAQATLNSQAPADPFTTSPPRTNAPADPFATHGTSAPADPFANSRSAPDNGAAAARAQANAEKHQAQRDESSATYDVNSSYQSWQQAHAARVQADEALAQEQYRYNDVAAYFNQADAVRAQAAGILQNAQANLQSHQSALANDQAGVLRANQQVAQGRTALAQAQTLKQQAGKYVGALSVIGDQQAVDAGRPALQEAIQKLAGMAVNPTLKANLGKQQVLIGDMARPLAPAGYVEATPLVMSEQ